MKIRLNFLNFFKLDWPLFFAVIFLIFFGLAAIYSVALGQGRGEFLNFQKQILWIIAGIVALFFFSNLNYRLLKKISLILYIIGIILLILVLPFGKVINGSKGWFNFGIFSFQPVELMKLFLILFLANISSKYSRTTHKLGQLFFISLIVLIPFILVMIQPDFGSGMVLFFTWIFTFTFLTKNKWHIVLITVLIIVLT